MDLTIVLSAAVTLVSATVSATLVYVFGVRSTRKGKLYDVKLETYSNATGSMQEAMMSIETNMRLLAILATPDKVTPTGVVRLIEELSKLGDIEGLSQMMDSRIMLETIQAGNAKDFLERYLMRAMILSNKRMVDHLSKLNSLYARIKIIGPSSEVAHSLEDAQEEIKNGGRSVVRLAEGLSPELSGVTDDLGEGKVYSTSEEWRTCAIEALVELTDSMVRDLRGTL